MKTSPTQFIVVLLTLGAFRFAKGASGDLDSSFGNGGIVTTAIGSKADDAHCMAIQPDGKILAAGISDNGSNLDFAVVRYTTTGALDTGFGTAGKVTVAVGTLNDWCHGIKMQGDGKILLAGASHNGSDYDTTLVRLTNNGLLDTTFGIGGKRMTPIGSGNDELYGLTVQSDGKIVAAGASWNGSNYDIAVVRYTSSGSLDSSFGNNGKVTTSLGGTDVAYSVVIQSDGKIVVCGATDAGSTYDIVVLRYTALGALDSSFGVGGKVFTDINSRDDSGSSLALQSDGKIVVSGASGIGGPYHFAVARYTSSGQLDIAFGSGGTVVTQIGNSDTAYGLAIQNDGRIVVAGIAEFGGQNPNGATKQEAALVRYTSSGSLDNGFGVGGTVVTPIGVNGLAKSVSLQPDGKLVVAGYSLLSFGAFTDFVVARYINAFAPTALTLSASSVTASSVVLNGTLNPNSSAGGSSTTGSFEYGLSTNYGSSSPSAPPVVNGNASTSVTASVSNLAPGMTYHFRVTGTSSVGTTNGNDLTFTTLTTYQTWKQANFGTISNSGNAADMADQDGDRLPNLMEFATNSSPVAFSVSPGTLVLNGANLEFTYPRSKEAVADHFGFTVEWSDSLASGSWSSSEVSESVLSDDGTVQQVMAVVPVGISGRRFVHLKVTAP